MTNSKHPFEKMFDKALRKSTFDENYVFDVADKLRSKGYRDTEIMSVLNNLQKALIDDNEALLVQDAIDRFEE
jgi:uncharacterized membrane-anchored protein